MSNQNESIDESYFEDDSQKGLGGVTETELWLKQFKPRRPFVDIALIEPTVSDDNATIPSTSVLPRETGNRNGAWSAGPLAASWMCGVVVGALFVSYSISATSPRNETQEVAVSPPLKQADPNEDLERSKQLANAERSDVPDRFQAASTLRMGGRYVKASEWMDTREWNQRRSKKRAHSADPEGIAGDMESVGDSIFSEYSPPLPTTQAELMRELLADSQHIVH